jgi:P27 family predicted phage terminase small subunit
MARPTKSANVLTDYSQTKDEIKARVEAEKKLRGKSDNVSPPSHLSKSQKKIFIHIVEELKNSGIIGNLDIYILSDCAFAIDQLRQIQTDINNDPTLKYDKSVKGARESFQNTFFRCCNELSLSPQSRAKIGNITIEKEVKETDPLLKALKRVK